MEEEARLIIEQGLTPVREAPAENLYQAIRRHIEPLGGVDLEIPPRGPGREPPDFSE
jgi:plasmid stability protein